MSKHHKCHNDCCQCEVSTGEEYCSESCEEASEGDESCDCGHARCHHSGLKPDDVPLPMN